MDCVKLIENLEIFGYAGVCISSEMTQLIHYSLLVLLEENHFRRCFYWGRINALDTDYHIAYGYTDDCLKSAVYYYSTNCLTWLLLPKIDDATRHLASLATVQFKGDPSLVIQVDDVTFKSIYEGDTTTSQMTSEKKLLKEEDRLAATVATINDDAKIVPRGGWLKTLEGTIVEHRNFEGLQPSESTCLSFYMHARLPQNKWNENLLSTIDYNYSLDFLDSIGDDVPIGTCWDLQTHKGGHLVLLFSQKWPGMIFHHKVTTPHFGSLYLGDGFCNLNMPFMTC